MHDSRLFARDARVDDRGRPGNTGRIASPSGPGADRGVLPELEGEAAAPPTSASPTEASSIELAIDGGHMKAVRSLQARSFEVLVAQVSNDNSQQIVQQHAGGALIGKRSSCAVCWGDSKTRPSPS